MAQLRSESSSLPFEDTQVGAGEERRAGSVVEDLKVVKLFVGKTGMGG